MKVKILVGLLTMVLVLVIGSMSWMPTASAETCPKCDGSGDCQECGGDGYVISVIFPCGHCGETGDCSKCLGSGYIITGAEIGICVGIVVIIIILIAIIVYAVKKKGTTVIRETPSYPQQYQQPPPPSQIYSCSICKQPLRYIGENINQNQRWYCDTCRKYV